MCDCVYVCAHMVMLHEIVLPSLGGDFCLTVFEEASSPLGRPRGQEAEDNLQPNSQQASEFLSPIARYISNPSNKHMSLEAEPSPVKPQMRLQLYEA